MDQRYILRNNLKKYRSKFGYTQSQLAFKVGVTKNTISSIETGVFYPSSYLALLLCHVFGCVFEDLFYFELRSDVE